MSLHGKNILLAVSGSIAAYKAAFLVRLLIKTGCHVKVIMSRSAVDFISPLTLSTLSKNAVVTSVADESGWNSHVELGLWADYMVVAPATAATLARMAAGLSDNIIVASYLSARCKVCVAPAMDVDMWHHPSTQHNLNLLKSRNVEIIPVGYGELASGLEGEGRMAEPEEILNFLEALADTQQSLKGKKVLITGGPTYEPIDPVRYIGNRSSGKMAYAIAEACHAHGAEVTMVSGPVSIDVSGYKFKIIQVETAEQMFDAVVGRFADADIAVFAAAVADFTVAAPSDTKLKKKGDSLTLTLTPTRDIAAEVSKLKKPGQITIGFALETDNEKNHALEKLHKKNLDFIVLNSLRDEGAGFQHETNKISVFKKDGSILDFPLKSKKLVARDIVELIKEYINQK